jgi:hypothetical protein
MKNNDKSRKIKKRAYVALMRSIDNRKIKGIKSP